MTDEITLKVTEINDSLRLHVYMDDGEPVSCSYYDETPGLCTYMREVELPVTIQNILIEHLYDKIMQRYEEYKYDKAEYLAL